MDASLSVEFNSAIWQGTTFEGQSITKQPYDEGRSSEFSWNIAGGFKKSMTDRLALRVEYGLLNRGAAWTGLDARGDAVKFSEQESQQVVLGIDWRFQ